MLKILEHCKFSLFFLYNATMKISLSWLREWAGKEWREAKLAETLTALGFEVEGSDGETMEVKVTANRGDALSIIGLARELCAKTNRPLPKLSIPSYPPLTEPVAITVESQADCPRYSLCLLQGVRYAPSPDDVQKRLLRCGMKPHSAVVDATNYVLLLLGQPLHAFDRDALGEIFVRRARPRETFLSLEGREHQLTPEDLVIANAQEAVALAGIIGGMNTAYRESTQRVLIESAHFAPSLVRLTARRLGLRTESSIHFERFVDPELTLPAAQLCAHFISEWTGAQVVGWQEIRKPFPPRTIATTAAELEETLGTPLKEEQVLQLLTSLGLSCQREKGKLLFQVPSYRADLKIPEDLAEETARHLGYDTLAAALPSVPLKVGHRSTEGELIFRTRQLLLQAGLQEVLTPSFCSQQDLKLLGGVEGAIPIRNPLTQETAYLRPSLSLGLRKVHQRNRRLRVETLSIFEIGKVFVSPQKEIWHVGWLLAGSLLSTGFRKMREDFQRTFHDGSTLFKSLFPQGREPKLLPSPLPLLHPSKSFALELNKERGFLGESAEAPPFFLAEVPLSFFSFLLDPPPFFEALPRFPVVERDLALVAPLSLKAGEIETTIQEKGGELIQKVEVFDCYQGKPLKKGEKSIGFHITYQAKERTLKDEEIDALEQEMVRALECRGVHLREGKTPASAPAKGALDNPSTEE